MARPKLYRSRDAVFTYTGADGRVSTFTYDERTLMPYAEFQALLRDDPLLDAIAEKRQLDVDRCKGLTVGGFTITPKLQPPFEVPLGFAGQPIEVEP